MSAYDGAMSRGMIEESNHRDRLDAPVHQSMLPKYTVSKAVGCRKEKSAIDLARVYGEWKKSLIGQHLWVRD